MNNIFFFLLQLTRNLSLPLQIYWVGPMAAGFLVTFIYKTVFWRDVPKEKPKEVEEFPLSDKNAA